MHSVTPLIEKEEGKPYLTRLCVIHLIEADYNLFLKIIDGHEWSRMANEIMPRIASSMALNLSK